MINDNDKRTFDAVTDLISSLSIDRDVSCTHKRCSKPSIVKTQLKKLKDSYTELLWICLQCGDVCSRRSYDEHFVSKGQGTSHCLAIPLDESKMVWCSLCSAAIPVKDSKVARCMEFVQNYVKCRTKRMAVEDTTPCVPTHQDSPVSDTRSISRDATSVLGLVNLGNTCFFNSVIQCFASLKEFPLGLANDPEQHGSLHLSLQRVLMEIRSSPSDKLDPASRKSKIKWSKKSDQAVSPLALFKKIVASSTRFKGFKQQDAHELLRCLMMGIREENEALLNHRRKSEIRSILKSWDDSIATQWFKELCMKDHSNILDRIGKDGVFPLSLLITFLTCSWKSSEMKKLRSEIGCDTNENSIVLKNGLKYLASGSHPMISKNLKASRSVIDTYFKGVLSSQIECLTCHQLSITEERFYDLSIPIEPPQGSGRRTSFDVLEGDTSIYDGLGVFTASEYLEGENAYGCENCTKKNTAGDDQTPLIKRDAEKRYLIKEIPPILTVHLKRFSKKGTKFSKSSKTVSFPRILEMSSFCDPPIDYAYSLASICEHQGSINGGHYIAHVLEEGQWYCCSDSVIRKESEDKALGSQAYLLFYERQI